MKKEKAFPVKPLGDGVNWERCMGKWGKEGRFPAVASSLVPVTPCLECTTDLRLPGQHTFLQDMSSILLSYIHLTSWECPSIGQPHTDTSEAIDAALCPLIHAALSLANQCCLGLAGLAFMPHAWAACPFTQKDPPKATLQGRLSASRTLTGSFSGLTTFLKWSIKRFRVFWIPKILLQSNNWKFRLLER